ncbi:MAG: hypothetical protein RSB29_03070 [Alistipes sp.]
MRKITVPFLIFSLIFITACTKDSNENAEGNSEPFSNAKITLSTGEWMSIAYDNAKEISEGDIRIILDNFLKQEYVAPKYQTRTGIDISSFNQTKKYGLAEKMAIVATRSGEVPIYDIDCTISEYEFELGGEKYRAVISTDERYPKVLALMKVEESTETNFTGYCENMPEQDASLTMLNLSYEAVYRHLFEIEAIKDSLRDETLLKISRELNEPIENISFDSVKDDICVSDNDASFTRANSIDFPTDQVLSGCFPILEVSWYTGNPVLKDYMPYVVNQLRPTAPDIVSAIMHILSFTQPYIYIPAQTYDEHGYKSGMSVNWTYLTENRSFNSSDPITKREMAGRLTRFISDQLGLIYNNGREDATGWSYGIGPRSNMTIQKGYEILKRYINCDPISNYNLNSIINSLIKVRPVYAQESVFVPAWVFDGFLKTKSNSGINSTYLHMESGSYFNQQNINSGYYLVNADSSLDIEWGNSSSIKHSRTIQLLLECRGK